MKILAMLTESSMKKRTSASPKKHFKGKQRQEVDKTLSNQKFFQQVANLKEKYEQMHNVKTHKDADQVSTLYQKYMARQMEPTTQSLMLSQTKIMNPQSTSLHQLSHSYQPYSKQNSEVKVPQTFNNNLHRFSLDNFRNQPASSTDMRFSQFFDNSQSVKGLRSFISTNNNINKSSSMSSSFNSRGLKGVNTDHNKNKQSIILPSQSMNTYFAPPNKHDRSEELNPNPTKYSTIGGRSLTIDQIDLKEQHTGRGSFTQQENQNPSTGQRYENILQNLMHRSSDDEKMKQLTGSLNLKILGQKSLYFHNGMNNNNLKLNAKSHQLKVSNHKFDVDDHQSNTKIMHQDVKDQHCKYNSPQKDYAGKDKIKINTEFLSLQPISQPQSTKNAESPYRLMAQQSLTSKMAQVYTDLKNPQNYFQFPTLQDNGKLPTISKIDFKKERLSPSFKFDDTNKDNMQCLLKRTQEILRQYQQRETQWNSDRNHLVYKLQETTFHYQQSQKEVKRLQKVILQNDD